MLLTRGRRAVPLANKTTMVSINKAESEAEVKLYETACRYCSLLTTCARGRCTRVHTSQNRIGQSFVRHRRLDCPLCHCAIESKPPKALARIERVGTFVSSAPIVFCAVHNYRDDVSGSGSHATARLNR